MNTKSLKMRQNVGAEKHFVGFKQQTEWRLYDDTYNQKVGQEWMRPGGRLV